MQAFDLTEEMSTNRWIFLCISIDPLNQTVTFAIFNNIVFFHKLNNSEQKDLENVQKIKIWWENILNRFTFPEKFALLNIHSNDKELTKYLCGEPGDLYAWHVEGWEQNLTLPTTSESTHQICQAQFQVYILPELSHSDALKTCKQINGNQFYANKAFQELIKLEVTRNKELVDFWVPYTDFKEEGVWRSIYNDSDVLNISKYFAKGQPNGGNTSNILIGSIRGLWDVSVTSNSYSSLCKIDKSKPYLVLRGLCLESQVERYYTAGNDFGKFVWKGFSFASIQYKDHWLLHNLQYSNVWAETNAKYDSIAIGTNTWTIHNDNCGDKLYNANLSLRLYNEYCI